MLRHDNSMPFHSEPLCKTHQKQKAPRDTGGFQFLIIYITGSRTYKRFIIQHIMLHERVIFLLFVFTIQMYILFLYRQQINKILQN